MPWVKNRSLDGCVTELEVENVLAMLKERKAPEPDRIPSEFIKYATPHFKASLVTAFNKFLGSEAVPKSFQKRPTKLLHVYLAAVWDGEQLSGWFTTEAGVKQPLLFFPFPDITDSLPCGIQICGCAIKALLYADDIVILAESPVELQTMIKALHKYCLLWGLLVNTEKLKVLIFKKHWRRLAQNEKWNLGSRLC